MAKILRPRVNVLSPGVKILSKWFKILNLGVKILGPRVKIMSQRVKILSPRVKILSLRIKSFWPLSYAATRRKATGQPHAVSTLRPGKQNPALRTFEVRAVGKFSRSINNTERKLYASVGILFEQNESHVSLESRCTWRMTTFIAKYYELLVHRIAFLISTMIYTHFPPNEGINVYKNEHFFSCGNGVHGVIKKKTEKPSTVLRHNASLLAGRTRGCVRTKGQGGKNTTLNFPFRNAELIRY